MSTGSVSCFRRSKTKPLRPSGTSRLRATASGPRPRAIVSATRRTGWASRLSDTEVAGIADVVDVAIVGAGAAGLATAIFARRADGHASVALLDGARTLGAKILVSGGSRCNVTN